MLLNSCNDDQITTKDASTETLFSFGTTENELSVECLIRSTIGGSHWCELPLLFFLFLFL